MGCTAEMDIEEGCYDNERPVHEVTLTRGFYMGRTEVTQAQWEAIMGSNPSHNAFCGDPCPVEKVTLNDIVTFANTLSGQDGLTPAYTVGDPITVDLDADGYRLPTESEWEYAARGGEALPYAGSSNATEVGWIVMNAGGKTHEVGTLPANAFGLHDMTGNVLEWVWDRFDDPYEDGPLTDPTGPAEGGIHVNRGGSFQVTAQYARSSYRFWNPPTNPLINLGFRLARSTP